MVAMSFNPTPALDRLRESIERADQTNRIMTRLTWIITGCTILLLIGTGIQLYLQLGGCR